jgi:hypothetical protein
MPDLKKGNAGQGQNPSLDAPTEVKENNLSVNTYNVNLKLTSLRECKHKRSIAEKQGRQTHNSQP